MEFYPYLKAVGTGPKGNRDLTFDEMQQAIRLILQGEVAPEVIGAFLVGLRIKEESMDELKGTKKAFDTMLSPTAPLPDSVELSYPFNGKKKHSILLPLIANEIPDIDLAVSVDSDLPTHKNTLLGLKESMSLPKNIHLYDRSEFFLWLSSLNSLRNNLKIRTIFNTVEKLLNPVQSKYAIIGAHHTPYFKKYAELFGSSYERLVILQGDEGSSEFFKKGKLTIIDDGKVTQQILLDPKAFDIDPLDIPIADYVNGIDISVQNPNKSLLNLAKLNADIIRLASKRIESLPN